MYEGLKSLQQFFGVGLLIVRIIITNKDTLEFYCLGSERVVLIQYC